MWNFQSNDHIISIRKFILNLNLLFFKSPSTDFLRHLLLFTFLLVFPFVSYSNPTLQWSTPYSTNGTIFSSPSIADDGTVYIGSNDNKLHAINSDGTAKWTFSTGDWVDSTPAIGPDGTVYVGSWDNQIYAIDPSDGTKLWDFNTSSSIISSPSIGVDGKIYFGSKDDFFYALESNGSLAWEVYIGNPVSSSAALGQDGTIYFGDENGTFHALNQDGSTKWTYNLDEVADSNKSILSSPAIDLVGNIYFGSGNGYCYSISDAGSSASLAWKYQTGDRVDASPVLGTSNEVFFVSRDGYLRSIDTTTGIVNWEVFCGDVFYSSPVVGANGQVFVVGYTGFGENHLFAFDSNGSLAWDTNNSSSPLLIGGLVDSSLALDQNGTLYFGCFNSKVYAVNVGTGLAESAWPQFKREKNRNGAWPSFLVEVGLSPLGAGDVNGNGIYNQGAMATLSVSSNLNEGYSFDNWSGAQTGSSNPLTFEVNSNLNLTANFSLNSYTLEVNSSIGGTASGSTSSVHGSLALISASPSSGYYFAGWTGDGITDSSTPSTTVSMNQTRTVTANFSLSSYTLTVNSGTGGTASGDNNSTHGSLASILALPSYGYSFAGWIGESISEPSSSSTTVSMTEARTVTASFSLNTYPLTLTAGNGGTVSGDGNFTHGTSAPILATPKDGYYFAGWTGGVTASPSSASTTVRMNQTQIIVATFLLNSYELTLNSSTGGLATGEGNFSHDSNVTIVATPSVGFSFAGWIGDGVADPNSASTTVKMTKERAVSASFSLNSYNLNIIAEDNGTTIGDGNFSFNSLAPINAFPESGYVFVSWTGTGITDHNQSSTTVLMNQDRNVTAQFSEKTMSSIYLAVSSLPSNGGTTSGAGSYSEEENASISASPLPGYSFSSWSGNGVTNPLSPTSNIIMDQDRNISAVFTQKSYNLYLASGTGGIISGSGSYLHGSNAIISASPSEGYLFNGWKGIGVSSPASAVTTVSMSEDRYVSALLAKKVFNLTIDPSAGGSAIGSGSYAFGSASSISASSFDGYSFSSWIGSGVTNPLSPNTLVTMNQDRNVSALFSINSYNLSIHASVGGSVTGVGSYPFGTTATINASPLAGYSFSSWAGNGITNPLSSSTAVTMNQDRNISALFSINSYNLSINEGVGGSVTGDGSYTFGTNVTITASPLAGYSFSIWTGNGITNALSYNTTVIMNQDHNISALFSRVMLSSSIQSQKREGNWHVSTWFGNFFESPTGWCYHSDLGWIYPDLSKSSIWIWSPQLKWLWIDSSTYTNSFTWSENEKNWIYLDFQNNSGPRIYSYEKNTWQVFFKD